MQYLNVPINISVVSCCCSLPLHADKQYVVAVVRCDISAYYTCICKLVQEMRGHSRIELPKAAYFRVILRENDHIYGSFLCFTDMAQTVIPYIYY